MNVKFIFLHKSHLHVSPITYFNLIQIIHTFTGDYKKNFAKIHGNNVAMATGHIVTAGNRYL